MVLGDGWLICHRHGKPTHSLAFIIRMIYDLRVDSGTLDGYKQRYILLFYTMTRDKIADIALGSPSGRVLITISIFDSDI